jgi:hypothetical protein
MIHIFLYFMWLFSRLIICISIGIAPLLPQPIKEIRANFSWDVFTRWDGEFKFLYLKILESI